MTLNHLAIIMDGNGRWANAKHLPRIAGHNKGAEQAKEIVKTSPELGIKYLTLYAFSSENWSRPAEEVSDLMNLLKFYLGKELSDLNKNNVRLKIIGDKSKLSSDIKNQIEKAEELTSNNDGLFLNIALSYGSRQEITNAARILAEKAKTGEIDPQNITEESFSKLLYTTEIPDPDLLIRTGGEQRISNFLLWQCAYTEFYFTDTLWPDFKASNLKDAVDEFKKRDRRYGNVEEHLLKEPANA